MDFARVVIPFLPLDLVKIIKSFSLLLPLCYKT